MGVFDAKTFRSKRQQVEFEKTLMGKYQKAVKRNSFLFLGLPMVGSVVLASVLLSNFTAVRYEQRDNKVQELDEESLMAIHGKEKRKVDLKEEYYRLQGLVEENENWEPVRVKRLKGESENVW